MIPNKQPPEKQVRVTKDRALDIHSIFHTIQGEGIFAGEPSIFIRLAGCNLQCPSCDTDYTSGREILPIEQILNKVLTLKGEAATSLIVITGGEPFRQELGPLVRILHHFKFRIQIETNGTLFDDDFPYYLATVICSPKAGKINHKLIPFIAAIKYVISADSVDETDGLPILALDHPCNPKLARPPKGFSGVVYLQPMDSQSVRENKEHLNTAIKSCMKHGYRLCLQLHKIIGME